MLVAHLCLLVLLLSIVACSISSLVTSQRCVLTLCRQWYTRRVHLLSSHATSAPKQIKEMASVLLAQGIRVTEEEIKSNISTEVFSSVMAYTSTAHIVLYPNNVSREYLMQALAADSGALLESWLLVLQPSVGRDAAATVEQFLAGVHVPYDSHVTVIVDTDPPSIFEVYRVSRRHQLTLAPVAACLPACSRSEWPRLARLQAAAPLHGQAGGRRSTDLQGVVLTAVHARPARDDAPDEWTLAYLVLWRYLAASLNFTLKVRVAEARLPEAGWGELLGEVQGGGADISLAPIAMLPSTARNISFTTPVHRTSLSVLVRGSANDRVRWNSFLQPFERPLWSALLTSVLLLSLVLAVLWRFEHEPAGTLAASPPRLPELLSECVLCVLGAACMQGHPTPPRSTSARCVHLTALVSAVVIVAVYSSSVTAFLAVTRDDRPFASLSQLLSNSRFRPLTLAGSPEHTIFQDSLNPALVRHRASAPPSTLVSLSVALVVACGHNASLLGQWSRRVPALVLSSLWVDRALDAAPCKLSHFPLADIASQHVWAAFPLKPNLPYARLINQRLHRMHEAGTILRFAELISLRAGLARAHKEGADKGAPRFTVALRDITPLLALLGCGAALALSLLAAESTVRHFAGPTATRTAARLGVETELRRPRVQDTKPLHYNYFYFN